MEAPALRGFSFSPESKMLLIREGTSEGTPSPRRLPLYLPCLTLMLHASKMLCIDLDASLRHAE